MTAEYAAGFFDGEGTVIVRHINRVGRRPHVEVSIEVANTHQEVLNLLCTRMDVGTVKPRSKRGDRPKPQWAWRVFRHSDVEKALRTMLPHLIVKRVAAERALAEIAKATK